MTHTVHTRFSFWTVALLALVIGCKSMPSVPSQWHTANANDGSRSVSANYDKSTRIAYQLRNDKEYFYLDLQISDMVNQAKLIWSGLRITVDTTGKRKSGLWFQYPFNPDSENFDKEKLRELMSPGPRGRNHGISLAVETISHDAAFGVGGEIGQFNLDAIDAVFDAKMKIGEAGILLYSIAIPFKRLPNISSEGLADLSIGLAIQGISMPSSFQGAGANNGSRPASNRPGAINNQPVRATAARQALAEPVRFWFVPKWADAP